MVTFTVLLFKQTVPFSNGQLWLIDIWMSRSSMDLSMCNEGAPNRLAFFTVSYSFTGAIAFRKGMEKEDITSIHSLSIIAYPVHGHGGWLHLNKQKTDNHSSVYIFRPFAQFSTRSTLQT